MENAQKERDFCHKNVWFPGLTYCFFYKRVLQSQLIYFCLTEINQLTLRYPFPKKAVLYTVFYRIEKNCLLHLKIVLYRIVFFLFSLTENQGISNKLKTQGCFSNFACWTNTKEDIRYLTNTNYQ